MAQGLGELQNTLNKNRQFQQEWTARQELGKTIAGAKNWKEAGELVQKSPYASWLPEVTTAIMGNAQVNQNVLSLQQSQAQSALEGVYKGLAGAASDPSKFDQFYKTAVGTIPQESQKFLRANGDPVGNIAKILGPMAKSDPEGFKKSLAALQLMTVSPSQVFATTNKVPPTLVPQPGGGQSVYGGFGTGQGGQSSPNDGGASSAPPSFIGKPLTPSPEAFIPSKLDSNGQPIRTPEEQQLVQAAAGNLAARQPEFDAAANTLSNLESAKAEIKELANKGGWLSPGPAGTLRLQLGSTLNTLYRVFEPGKEPPVDIAKEAAGEALVKNNINSGFNLVSSMMGGHEGLGVLQHGVLANPGINSSPLGGLLLSDLLSAAANWKKDQGTYLQNMANRNRGDIRNGEESFRQDFPPTAYISKVLDKYGIGSNGEFKAPEAVRDAYRDKLITRDMAAKILKDKFGGQ